jgi:hypothetical protein
MKRTVQINLGGVPLTIDDDAYRKLDGYLIELETYFSKSGNQEEIMVDIESRVAELLSDMIKSRPIVEMSDVEAAIKVMGTPTDFDDVGAGTAGGSTGARPWMFRRWSARSRKKSATTAARRVCGSRFKTICRTSSPTQRRWRGCFRIF